MKKTGLERVQKKNNVSWKTTKTRLVESKGWSRRSHVRGEVNPLLLALHHLLLVVRNAVDTIPKAATNVNEQEGERRSKDANEIMKPTKRQNTVNWMAQKGGKAGGGAEYSGWSSSCCKNCVAPSSKPICVTFMPIVLRGRLRRARVSSIRLS